MQSARPLWTGICVGLLFLLTTGGSAQDAPPQAIQFNRDIRPILSENCFTCHGPDQSHRVSKFRFDLEASAKQDLGGGRFAIVPGDPAGSLLIQRITHEDVRRRMPPASTGHTLSDRQIALLKDWVKQGAKWEKHWSFAPPVRPAVPAVADASRVRNAIDNFVLRRLEQEGVKPSPEADRATLLRRVTLDLTGKGPTPAQLDAFLADKSPNAYEKVVDRLLQSPQYGERMALPWLDAARYADTNGYQNDHERYMWRWRDWVIAAFNRNLPFDQFAIEQLAGDLLPNPTLDQKIATGFNRNHRINVEGGIIPAEFAAEYVVDRVSTTSSVFLGLTMGCARCHDHKYDPLTQKEFYQLFAYFNNVPEPGHGRRGNTNPHIKAPTAEQQAELKRLDDQIKVASTRLAGLEPAAAAAEAAWLKSLTTGQPAQWAPSRNLVAYVPLDGNLNGVLTPAKAITSSLLGYAQTEKPVAPPEAIWKGAAGFDDGMMGQAGRFDGNNPIELGDVAYYEPTSKFTIGAWIYPTGPNGAIVGRFQDQEGGKGYSLQLKDGKLEMLWGFRVPDHLIWMETEKPIELNRWHHVAATYGGVNDALHMTLYVDGVAQKVKVNLDILNETPNLTEPLRIGGTSAPGKGFHGLIDEVRLYDTELAAEEVAMLAASRSLNALAALAPAQRTAAESAKIRMAFLESGAAPAAVRTAFQQLSELRQKRAAYYESVPTVMVMEEMATPRETRILLRGAYDQPGDAVTPDVPSILPPMPSTLPRNRLGLARWLVDPSNPLTARVAVNRFWQMYFGAGIVKTVDDFGSQGEAPSHPELLDWLATEFMRTGWNIKALQKTIVMSATYRQASQATPEMVQRDPENRLLARGARFRLPAEMVRDQALSMAGLLVEKQGGPSVKPYQPEGLWSDLLQTSGGYQQDHGDNLYRRSLYTFWRRTVPPPSMSNFDAPTRESCILVRGFTNSPLQALNLMNDVTFLEASRLVAERMIKEGGIAPQDRIAFAFRIATSRRPSAKERQVLSESLNYALSRFRARPESAVKYLNMGEHPRDQEIEATELAAYTVVASLIMNLDETVTKE